MPETTELDARIGRVKRYQSESQHDDDAIDYGEDRYITDLQLLAFAHIAELDTTLVDEKWLRETLGEPDDRGFGLDWNFGNYRIELTRGTIEVWMLLKTRVAINPTRGLVRTLQRIGGGM